MVIHYTTRFVHELDEQADYLAQYSATRASLVVNSVFRQLDLLRQHPQLGRMVPKFGNEKVRELLYRQYRIITAWFRLNGLTCWHSRPGCGHCNCHCKVSLFFSLARVCDALPADCEPVARVVRQ